MTHKDTRIIVVLVLALHSQSQSQWSWPQLSDQLKCEEGICTSGYPKDNYDGLCDNGTPCNDCSTQYSNCDVIKKISESQYVQRVFGEWALIDLVQLAKEITRQHEQVLAALEVVQGTIREMDLQPQGGKNATSQLLVELETLRGRQAASAALQVVQFLLFIGYLLTLSIIYVVKQCQKHRERLAEEEVELIEQKLQERKAKRRAAAAKAKAVPGPNQE